MTRRRSGHLQVIGNLGDHSELPADGPRLRECCVLGSRDVRICPAGLLRLRAPSARQSAGMDNEAAGRQSKMAASPDQPDFKWVMSV